MVSSFCLSLRFGTRNNAIYRRRDNHQTANASCLSLTRFQNRARSNTQLTIYESSKTEWNLVLKQADLVTCLYRRVNLKWFYLLLHSIILGTISCPSLDKYMVQVEGCRIVNKRLPVLPRVKAALLVNINAVEKSPVSHLSCVWLVRWPVTNAVSQLPTIPVMTVC